MPRCAVDLTVLLFGRHHPLDEQPEKIAPRRAVDLAIPLFNRHLYFVVKAEPEFPYTR